MAPAFLRGHSRGKVRVRSVTAEAFHRFGRVFNRVKVSSVYTDATISLRESGSDRIVTIRRNQIEKFVPADNIKYGGMVTLRRVQ